ncbi:peptide chain release factor N(5)-glutamine methyltransferase [Deinococcus sp.]|uniref:peptide chain release factor N(5)-glutamine methyltransferase n=1 Tax=Deinococcus sp. TaxID=47478 RepID=UPI0025FE5E8A|nr:peptide chain release factor N(5)-glutamine methyltransferase [Deinococcus sp.]
MTQPSPASSSSLTVQAAWRELAARFRLAGLPSPEVDARELLGLVTALDTTGLVIRAAQVLSAEQTRRLEALARRREARQPLQHLLGVVEWAGLNLHVSPDALIPRPETEVLLELALDAAKHLVGPRILDVGTGTGALALGLKQARPDAAVTASDVSAPALALATRNAALNGLAVSFVQADLLTGLRGPYDLLVSNPPYLPAADEPGAQPEVRFDPALALYSGPDGLDLARRLVNQASGVLAPGGVMLLELDPRNVGVLAAELMGAGWRVRVHSDLTGRARFLEGRLGV